MSLSMWSPDGAGGGLSSLGVVGFGGEGHQAVATGRVDDVSSTGVVGAAVYRG